MSFPIPALHSSLTVEQRNRIESFQKRALKIIYNDFTSGDNAYAVNCILFFSGEQSIINKMAKKMKKMQNN